MSSIIVIMGSPGSGKGIQSRMLAEDAGLPRLSAAGVLRETAQSDTPLGRDIRLLQDSGQTVTDELIFEAILKRTAQPDCARGYILSGFPLTPEQAQMLDEIARRQGRRIQAFELTAPQPALLRHLAGRRACPQCRAIYNLRFNPPRQTGVCDHDGAALTQHAQDQDFTRLYTWQQFIRPLEEYYQNSGRLLPINAARTMEDVFFDLRLSATGWTSGA